MHVQIASKSKLFSSAPYSFGAPPNSQVSSFDASIPGTLPVLNRRCVEAAVRAAMALNCTVHEVSQFERKHYYYADMPAGYQVTQQRRPLATGGYLDFPVFVPSSQRTYQRRAVLRQLQLEQDSGKSLHDGGLVDLNRAGVGLLELVFEPCLTGGEEAASLARELLLLLRSTGVCSGKMEEGALRVDANVSVNRPADPPGVRTEIKNLNSLRAVASAVEYEIARQIEELSQGRPVQNWTMAFDAETRRTLPMRDKEVAQDYRFLPEPNLPPLVLTWKLQRRAAPTPPGELRRRLVERYGLSLHRAQTLLSEEGLLRYFEEVTERGGHDAGRVAHWLLCELSGVLRAEAPGASWSRCPVDSARFGQLMTLLEEGAVSHATALAVLRLLARGDGRTPREIVRRNRWHRITDERELAGICLRAMEERPDSVEKVRSGKTKALNPLMASVRALTDDRADMALAKTVLLRLIKESQ